MALHILAADRPRLDAPPGRRHGHEPVRPGRALARLGPPRHGGRRRPTRAPSAGRAARRPASSCTAWASRADGLPPRGLGRAARRSARDADVVLEVINGIAFFTPLWLRRPRVDARPPRPPRPLRRPSSAGAARSPRCSLETLPLRCSTAATPFLTISRGGAARPGRRSACRRATCTSPTSASSRSQFAAAARARRRRGCSTSAGSSSTSGSSSLLDVLEALPEARLDDRRRGRPPRRRWRPRSRAAGLGDRVTMHGHVDEDDEGRALRAAPG